MPVETVVNPAFILASQTADRTEVERRVRRALEQRLIELAAQREFLQSEHQRISHLIRSMEQGE